MDAIGMAAVVRIVAGVLRLVRRGGDRDWRCPSADRWKEGL